MAVARPHQPGDLWDWPNQQVVRADESGPGHDTNGGGPPPGPTITAAVPTTISVVATAQDVVLTGTNLDSSLIDSVSPGCLLDGTATRCTASSITVTSATSATLHFDDVAAAGLAEGNGGVALLDNTGSYLTEFTITLGP